MKKLKPVNGKYIVAVGEGAGKRHEVLDAPGLEVFEMDDRLLVKTGNIGTKITHPEHGTFLIPANDEIEIIIQEEYNDVGQYQKIID